MDGIIYIFFTNFFSLLKTDEMHTLFECDPKLSMFVRADEHMGIDIWFHHWSSCHDFTK